MLRRLVVRGTQEYLCRKNRGGMGFCRRQSLDLLDCWSRFHVGIGRVVVWLRRLGRGVGSGMQRIV